MLFEKQKRTDSAMPSNLDERQEEAEGYVVPKQTRREADDEEEIPFSLAACLLCSIVCLVVLVVVIALPLVLLGDDDRWGLTTTQSISPTLSPTALSDRDELDKLGEIHQRGTLRCGVAEMPARAELNPETGEYEGFSVDFVSAYRRYNVSGMSTFRDPIAKEDSFLVQSSRSSSAW